MNHFESIGFVQCRRTNDLCGSNRIIQIFGPFRVFGVDDKFVTEFAAEILSEINVETEWIAFLKTQNIDTVICKDFLQNRMTITPFSVQWADISIIMLFGKGFGQNVE